MADQEQVRILRSGIAEPWNAWRMRMDKSTFIDLRQADLHGAYLSGVKLQGAVLEGADLSGADLRAADLTGADLCGADLHGAIFSHADLSRAYLTGTNLHGAILRATHLREASAANADLADADLEGADLRGANLGASDLRSADFRSADLSDAHLVGADLTSAGLEGANLSRANLGEANLRGAFLRNAIFIGAHFNNTIFDDALFDRTFFSDADLGSCIGLESCRYWGPSSIDTWTLQRSGPLPLAFLRGFGLPDSLIEYLPSLLNQAIQHYSCFISYSSKDDDFVHRLHADLQNKGVRCWFAPHDLPIGAKIRDTIDDAIRLRDKVLLVLSAAAIASDWVEDEVDKAFEEERSRGGLVLFPVRLDDSVLETNEAWAAKLRRSRNIGDFRAWKNHDAYQSTLERLLRDLRVTPPEGI